MTLTYKTKFELVQRLRQRMDWLINFCDCAGDQPTMEDAKEETHFTSCEYRKRIEKQEDREVR